MPETIVATLLWNGQEADFELPAKVPLKGFAAPLGRALKLAFPGIFLQGMHIRLKKEYGFLAEDATLEDYGIFDGAVLQVELTQEGGTGHGEAV